MPRYSKPVGAFLTSAGAAPLEKPEVGIESTLDSVAMKSVFSSSESAMPVMPFEQYSFDIVPPTGPAKMQGGPMGTPP